jgi:hypothetical protein
MIIPSRLSQYVPRSRVQRHDLDADFAPEKADVICGERGRGKAYNHTGNARLRVVVGLHLRRYSQATNKKEKTNVLLDIINDVRATGGRFVAFENGSWHEVGDRRAQEKGKIQPEQCAQVMYTSCAMFCVCVRALFWIVGRCIVQRILYLDGKSEGTLAFLV